MSAGPLSARSLLEVWFDPICPWTYLGERRLAKALDSSGLADDVEVIWRSFELDPHASRQAERTATQVMLEAGSEPRALTARWAQIHDMAAAAGIAIDMNAARPVNTHDAHRLVHLARTRGLETDLVGRLFKAYHSELRNIAEPSVLIDVGRDVGLPVAEMEAMLASELFSRDVRAEQARAARLGVRGVPTAMVNQRVIVPLLRSDDDMTAALTAALSQRSDAG